MTGCLHCDDARHILAARYRLAVRAAEEITEQPDHERAIGVAEGLAEALRVIRVDPREIERIRATGEAESER